MYAEFVLVHKNFNQEGWTFFDGNNNNNNSNNNDSGNKEFQLTLFY